MADQRRRNDRRIAGVQPVQKQQRQRQKQRERYQDDDPAPADAAFFCCGFAHFYSLASANAALARSGAERRATPRISRSASARRWTRKSIATQAINAPIMTQAAAYEPTMNGRWLIASIVSSPPAPASGARCARGAAIFRYAWRRYAA